MNTMRFAIALGLAAAATAALPASVAAQAPAEKHYSVETTLIGKLIDDPAAAAILQKMIPTIWSNSMFQTAGRDITLKAVQQYEAGLTDAKLAEIQAEFDKIPAKD